MNQDSQGDVPRRIHALTGVRFFAALAVLFYHCGIVLDYPGWLQQVSSLGPAGVNMFFVLSGFILYYTYRNWFACSVRRTAMWTFLRARFARVYPMHIATHLVITPILLLLLVTVPSLARDATTIGITASSLVVSWIANALLIQVYFPIPVFWVLWNSPAWSISCEFVFYLVFHFL